MKSILPAEVAGTSSHEVLLVVDNLRREVLKDKINKGDRLRIMRAIK
jgi:hypothetical protein